GEEVMRVLLDLNASGQTVFMVTHNPSNAALAHRVLNIRDGRLCGEGIAPAETAEAAPELLTA
ncbi:MAG TPA: hypothetical protein VD968_14600, partial [Pyrinomonadaceae bacterium]|nr:hypothetical protein [Pyrinomonadaceae bacterium]